MYAYQSVHLYFKVTFSLKMRFYEPNKGSILVVLLYEKVIKSNRAQNDKILKIMKSFYM